MKDHIQTAVRDIVSKTWIAHDYQALTGKFAMERPYAGLLLDPGLGKTSIVLDMLNNFKQKTLIIAPLRVAHLVWPSEIQKWTNFNNIKCAILHGPNKEKEFLRNDVGVYIINPEGLLWLDKMIAKHRRFPFKVLVVDESTKFKAPKSKRFKCLKRWLRNFDRRYILTGSLSANGLLDIWAQIYILDLGRSLGDTFIKFRNRYFFQADYQGFKFEPHDWAEEAIKEKIKPFCIHLSAKDHIDLPELHFNDIYFDLPPAIMKQYKQMEDKLFSELAYDDSSLKVVASSAGVAYSKCRQIVQGFMFETLDELEKLQGVKPKAFHIHDEKINILSDLMEELNGEPLLVAFHFRPDLLALQKFYKKKFGKNNEFPYIGSGISMDQAKSYDGKWNRGELPMLGGHPKSMAHGLNLQECGYHVAWYCLTDSFEDFDQLNRRIYRQGIQADRVIVHRLIARNTVDEATILNLENKGNTQASLLKALKRYRGIE